MRANRRDDSPERQQEDLLDLIDAVLGDYFFDPEAEDAYKDHLAAARKHPDRSALMLVRRWTGPDDARCELRLDALAAWTRLRITLHHAAAVVVLEGAWSFEGERLQQAVVLERPADPAELQVLIAAIHAHVLQDGGLDDPA